MNEIFAVENLPWTRPPGIPEDISREDIIAAVRAFLHGATHNEVAVMVGVPVQKFYSICKSSRWQFLQMEYRDEFVKTLGGRLVRTQEMLLDKIDDQIQNGVKAYTMEGQEYTRHLTAKELVQIATMLNAENKRLDSLKDKEINRKTFDAQGMARKFEAIAEVAAERVA